MRDVEDASTREHHLLDGRRVTLADLVESGLLRPGAPLAFTRLGTDYEASVTEEGKIRLSDGREFAAPSRAAAEVLGRRGGDGWYVWRVAGDRLLHDLREQLLDRAALADDADGQDDLSRDTVRRRHDYLRDARSRAEGGDPLELSVRDLIAWWGAKGRGHRVNQRIEADLVNHGLTTQPSFRKVTIDAPIVLATKAVEEPATSDEDTDVGSDDEVEPFDVGLTIGNIPSAAGGVRAINPNASIDQAITLMLLDDISQLAVMEGERTLKGAVSWRSIARARHTNSGADLSDAIERAPEARFDRDLIEVLPTLADTSYVFVRDEHNLISGIVTTSDVALAYRELATPFLLIGEIDQLLRRVIARSFDIEDVVERCDGDGTRGITLFDDMAFGDYLRVLETPANWARLGWPLDRSAFVKRLDEIREIRNDVMHFNPDSAESGAEDSLRNFVKLLKDFVE